MTRPLVDVIIPVHDPNRPIRRAVASVLQDCVADVRVNVICHNVSPSAISQSLRDLERDSRVRLLELHDAIPSPAGPINLGYRSSTAEFTALLDSDDEYEPGAVDAWLRVQGRDDADVVIQPLRYANGGSTRTPPTRPFRTRKLDGVRDRLAYRTRQHGLVRRERFAGLAMTPSLRTGEDVIQGATIWYSGASISYAKGAPAYLIHTDEEGRTSTATKPAAESLRFLDAVLATEFVSTLSPAQVESFAVKLLRTHILDVLGACLRSEATEADLVDIRMAIQRIVSIAPSSRSLLSRREAAIITDVLGAADVGRLRVEHGRHTDYRRLSSLPGNLLPGTISKVLHREAPLRFLTALALMR